MGYIHTNCNCRCCKEGISEKRDPSQYLLVVTSNDLYIWREYQFESKVAREKFKDGVLVGASLFAGDGLVAYAVPEEVYEEECSPEVYKAIKERCSEYFTKELMG